MGQTPQNSKNVEQLLGLRYAQELEKHHKNIGGQGLYKECKEIIDQSLHVLEAYNKLRLSLQWKQPPSTQTAQ